MEPVSSAVDYDLIAEARRYITGANIHFVKTWIFCYEISPPGTSRRLRYETLLQNFVSAKRQFTMTRNRVDAQRQELLNLSLMSTAINRRIQD